MQEDDFDAMKPQTEIKDCKVHEFVKLYQMGSHVDYGCVHCGFKTTTPDQYNGNNNADQAQ